MTVNDIYTLLDKWYPFDHQDIWDKSGSFTFFNEKETTGIIIGLDVTENLVLQAIEKKCNVIITHHPIYIDEDDTKKKHIKNIIKILNDNEISLFSLHTNFDKNKYGMNYSLLKKLGLKNIKKSQKSDYLFFGELKDKIEINQFLSILDKKMNPDYVIFDKNNDYFKNNKKIKKIGIVGGSGSNDYEKILKKDKIDLFVTGEVKWHVWNISSKSIPIIDIGHSVEKIFTEVISSKLKQLNINIYCHKLEIKLTDK